MVALFEEREREEKNERSLRNDYNTKALLRTVPTNSKVFLPRFMIMQEM